MFGVLIWICVVMEENLLRDNCWDQPSCWELEVSSSWSCLSGFFSLYVWWWLSFSIQVFVSLLCRELKGSLCFSFDIELRISENGFGGCWKIGTCLVREKCFLITGIVSEYMNSLSLSLWNTITDTRHNIDRSTAVIIWKDEQIECNHKWQCPT